MSKNETDFSQSPCIDCERSELDKSRCVEICDRLQAWRDLDSMWVEIKIPNAEELGEVKEDQGQRQKDQGSRMKTKGECKIDGCNNPTQARGFCHTHYYRWRSKGLRGFPPFRVIRPRISENMKKARRKKIENAETSKTPSVNGGRKDRGAEGEESQEQWDVNKLRPGISLAGLSESYRVSKLFVDEVEELASAHVDGMLSTMFRTARPLMIRAFMDGHKAAIKDNAQ